MDKVNIMGVEFDPFTCNQAIERFVKYLRGEEKFFVVTPNPEILMNSSKNTELYDAISAAKMVIADGVGVIYAAKILKKPLTHRVTGVGLMDDVLKHLSQTNGSFYLLGSKPGVAELAAKNIVEKFSGIRCAGYHDGYFSKKEETELIDKINKSNADVIFVGLGSPKQEIWVHENLRTLNIKACMCIGGAIDVNAGVVKRAPKWISKIGFEWLYRAIKEPARFKRLLVLPAFLLNTLKLRFNS